MSYRHTSLGRPSHATLERRAAFDRQFDHAQLVANIPHLWSVVANVAFLQLEAEKHIDDLDEFALMYADSQYSR